MTENKFEKELSKIQSFMWLDNWDLQFRIIEIEQDSERWFTDAKVEKIFYDYFRANISFSAEPTKGI